MLVLRAAAIAVAAVLCVGVLPGVCLPGQEQHTYPGWVGRAVLRANRCCGAVLPPHLPTQKYAPLSTHLTVCASPAQPPPRTRRRRCQNACATLPVMWAAWRAPSRLPNRARSSCSSRWGRAPSFFRPPPRQLPACPPPVCLRCCGFQHAFLGFWVSPSVVPVHA